MSNAFWEGKTVCVTGARGFLGSHIVEALEQAGVMKSQIRTTSSTTGDLRNRNACREVCRGVDVVIHAAARVGGIGYNKANPGTIFYDNIIMNTELMEAARLEGVSKFVAVGSVCSYPNLAPIPLREASLWDGEPEQTNAAYGLAKKMLIVQAKAYRQQYGMNVVVPLLENLYGPRDRFDAASSHVIPAAILKIGEARDRKDPFITAWGSGNPTRGFLYVADAARALVFLTERYDAPDPINVGSGTEMSIHDLTQTIAELMHYPGEIRWDTSKPDGQMRRAVDISRIAALGWQPTTSFKDDLRQTVDWWEAHRHTL